MSATKVMIRAWLDAVIKPMLQRSMREGLPLRELGGALIGYGAGVLYKGAKLSHDEIREVLEACLAENPPES